MYQNLIRKMAGTLSHLSSFLIEANAMRVGHDTYDDSSSTPTNTNENLLFGGSQV